MKIFPLRPMSNMDRVKILINLIDKNSAYNYERISQLNKTTPQKIKSNASRLISGNRGAK